MHPDQIIKAESEPNLIRYDRYAPTDLDSYIDDMDDTESGTLIDGMDPINSPMTWFQNVFGDFPGYGQGSTLPKSVA